MAAECAVRNWLVFLLILLLVGAAFFVDYVATGFLLSAAFYAIPLLLAAYLLPPRVVATLAALVAGSYLLAAWYQEVPLWTTALREGGLVFIGYVAAAFSARMRREAALRTKAEGLAEEGGHVARTLQALIDTIPAGVLISDATGTITTANPAAGSLLGGPVVGEPYGSHNELTLHRVDGSPYPASELPLGRAIEKEQITRNARILVRREDGTEKVVLASGAPVRNVLGRVTGAVAVFQDISSDWLAEAMLQIELEARRELESIVNRGPAVAFLWRATRGWPVEFVSENVAQFGYTPEDFMPGRLTYAEIIHPEDLERVAAEVSHGSREGRTEFAREYRILTRSGEVRWVDDRSWVRRAPDGKVTHYQGVVLDVTERKLAEAERERLAAILEATPDFVGIADVDGRVLYLNGAARAMLGLGESEGLRDRRVRDNHPGWATELILGEAFPTAIRQGAWRGVTAVSGREGREIPVSMVILAHRGPGGAVEFLSTISRDLTERGVPSES